MRTEGSIGLMMPRARRWIGAWRRTLAGLALALATVLVASGHIGDNNTHFRGEAGPWTVQVTVRHPGVIPGLADVVVRVEESGAERVTARPARADVGLEGAPAPDEAERLDAGGEESGSLWSTELWLMTDGAYSVHVSVEGQRGEGTAVVPVMSVANRMLQMEGGRVALLLVLGALLVSGGLGIVRAGAVEALLPPGESPSPGARRREWMAMGGALIAMVALLVAGKAWWEWEETAYQSRLYEPLEIEVAARVDSAAVHRRLLDIVLVDPEWTEGTLTPLVPDHGKLMHAFLVGTDVDAFAHVHPVPISRDTFRLAAPPLPAGRYAIYADLTHESGFAHTVVGEVELGEPAVGEGEPRERADGATGRGGDPGRDAVGAAADEDARLAPDPDDSWWVGEPAVVAVAEPGDAVARFPDGTAIRWADAPARAAVDEPLTLRFSVEGPDGDPVAVVPYMGMVSHAAVHRDDGSVFVHLHPTGSIYMAARDRMTGAGPEAGSPGGEPEEAMQHGSGSAAVDPAPDRMGASSEVTIPYAFPRPGSYRLWIQFKLASGEVRTAAFDVGVRER